jgi:hypothetical protein
MKSPFPGTFADCRPAMRKLQRSQSGPAFPVIFIRMGLN